MCFYNDYKWTASICNWTEGPAETPTKCRECGRPIAAGEWCKSVYMQEHEECRRCEWEELEEGEEPCAKHNYGETYDYDRCESCDKILRAIEAVETEEGCPVDARQPNLEMLFEELWEHSNARQYVDRALSMFPELAGNEQLAMVSERWEE